MPRFSETEEALVTKLRSMNALPEMSINLVDIKEPLCALGFVEQEIVQVLKALEQDGIIAFASGNRLRITKILPV